MDYTMPFLLDTVFKEEPKVNELTGKVVPGKERKAAIAAEWGSIGSLQEYPYQEAEWEEYPGPKFYIFLYEQGSHLCLGDFKTMFNHWKKYLKWLDTNEEDIPGSDENEDN
jgi:hypothetical protein